jgi:hypothetical protein
VFVLPATGSKPILAEKCLWFIPAYGTPEGLMTTNPRPQSMALTLPDV